nr:substrate-binding domain-containing protein [Demequina sp. TTPB684]
MIKGAIEAARDRGFMVFVAETSGNLTQEHLLLDAMFDRQVDGLILASMFTQERDIPPAVERTPAVLLNIGPTSATNLPVVLPDEHEAGRQAAQALLDAGHRDIHLVGAGLGPEGVPARALAGVQRRAGILSVMAEHGLEPASGHIAHQWLPKEGWLIVSELLKDHQPGALICFNDRLAMGAYQALQERGLSIPEDVSVVSFDDASIASWLRPGLTTFALPHRSMGKRAADLLITQIELERAQGSATSEGGTHLIPMPMRDRESLGPPRA